MLSSNRKQLIFFSFLLLTACSFNPTAHVTAQMREDLQQGQCAASVAIVPVTFDGAPEVCKEGNTFQFRLINQENTHIEFFDLTLIGETNQTYTNLENQARGPIIKGEVAFQDPFHSALFIPYFNDQACAGTIIEDIGNCS